MIPATKGEDPDNPSGDDVSRNREGDDQRSRGSHKILTGRSDVEQSGFERDRDRKSGHDERRRLEEHISELEDGVLGVAGRKRSGKHRKYSDESFGEGNILVKDGEQDENDESDGKSAEDAYHRRDHRAEPLLFG